MMIHQDIKGLAKECDEMIRQFISLNIPIADTKGEHTLMVFRLVRHGYTLLAYSSTRLIKTCKIRLDDAFHLDELLADLHTDCCNAIDNSERYSVCLK